MRAQRAYRLIVTRGGHAPAWLADAGRVDRVEVVAVEDGEVLLFRELAPRPARRLVRALREDLGHLSPDEFRAAWGAADRAAQR